MSDASAVVLAIHDALKDEIARLETQFIPVVDDFDPPIGTMPGDPRWDTMPSSREHPSLRLIYANGRNGHVKGWRYWVETDELHWLVMKINGYLEEMRR